MKNEEITLDDFVQSIVKNSKRFLYNKYIILRDSYRESKPYFIVRIINTILFFYLIKTLLPLIQDVLLNKILIKSTDIRFGDLSTIGFSLYALIFLFIYDTITASFKNFSRISLSFFFKISKPFTINMLIFLLWMSREKYFFTEERSMRD
jgi:hypothetical protein